MIAKHAVHPLCSGNNKVVITYKESKFLTSNDGLKPFQVGCQNPMGRLTIGWSSVKISKFGLISGEEKVEGLTTWNRFSSVMANHYAWNDHFPHIYRLWFNLVVFWKVNEPVFYHWQRYDYGDEIARAFQQLSWLPNPQTLDANLEVLDRFLATLYDKDRENMFVDDVRYQISGRLSRMIGKPWLRVKWRGSLLRDLESCKGILQLSCKNLGKYPILVNTCTLPLII